MLRVLIVGCGDIGSSLGLRLVAQGHKVWGLRRRIDSLPPELIAIQADLAEPESDSKFPSHLDFIFIITTADRFDETAYRHAYVDVAINVARIAEATQTNLSRVIFVSSTSVYGERDGEWVDENVPPTANSFSGRMIREAETVLLQSGLPVCIVRSAGIYGPGRDRTVQRVRCGQATCSPGNTRFVNLIHRVDLVATLEHVMKLNDCEQLYLAVDHEPVERNRLLCWLAHELGVPEPSLQVEEPDAYRRSKSNKRCRNQRLLATGFSFTYPTYKDGYRTLLHHS